MIGCLVGCSPRLAAAPPMRLSRASGENGVATEKMKVGTPLYFSTLTHGNGCERAVIDVDNVRRLPVEPYYNDPEH